MDNSDKVDIINEQVRLRKESHKQWLKLPVTQELIRGLARHESMLIDNSAEDAVRILAAVRTVRTMQKWIADTDQFVHMTYTTNNSKQN